MGIEFINTSSQGGLRMQASKQKNPVISIIAVTFNAKKHISAFLKNTSKFRSDAVELIIIDGGSTDGTIEILQKNNDNIDYWLSEPDKGIYDAMNKATKHTKGNWLYFTGVDDILLPDFLMIQPKLSDDHTIYYGDVVYRGERIISKTNKKNIARYNICHQAILYPKSVFLKYQYNTLYHVKADYHLNILCFGDNDFKFSYLNIGLAEHIPDGYSAMNLDKHFNRDKPLIVRRNLGFVNYIKYLWWKTKNKENV